MQDSSSSDNPDTKEGKKTSSLLCHKCLSMAEFLRDQEGERACTEISLNCHISCTAVGGSDIVTLTPCGTLIPGGSGQRLAHAD